MLITDAAKIIAQHIAEQNVECGINEQSEEDSIINLDSYGVNVDTVEMYINHYGLHNIIVNHLKNIQPAIVKASI